MKKRNRILFLLVCAMMLLMLAGCGGTKVVFDIGDATLVSGTLKQTYKDGVVITPPEITKEGYVLAGWDGDYQTPSSATTVKPIWKKIHTVVFSAEEGVSQDGAKLTQQVVDGEAAEAPSVSREGYELLGWSEDFSSVTGDMTIKAEWIPLYTVTFDLNGGTAEDDAQLTQTVRQGEAALSPTVSKNHYDFVQWSADISSITENITVKAEWKLQTLSATEIFKCINPGTVEINTYRLNGFAWATGSGFFISEDGQVVTNYHVIENAREIVVKTSEEKEYSITHVIAYDKEKDIAILQADIGSDVVSYLDISEELPQTGDAVYALGSSLGLTGTFSSGIVSTVNRELSDAPGVKYIQTTAPISSGNSGGPLVNEAGLVVGINTASYSNGQNLNLAVEISQIDSLEALNLSLDDFFKKEATIKYWIGENVVSEISEPHSTSAMRVANGTTVHGIILSSKEEDSYCTSIPTGESIQMIMINVNSTDALYNLLYSLAFSPSTTFSNSADVDEENILITAVPNEDGSITCLIFVYIDQLTSLRYRNVIISLGTEGYPIEYDIFFYSLTEEDFEDLMG